MKISHLLKPLMILWVACSSPSTMAEDSAKTPALNAVAQAVAAKDHQRLATALEDVERLWPQNPGLYLKTVKEIAPVLRDSGNSGTREAALRTFDRVLEKASPPDVVQATDYFKTKREIILDYLNLEEIRNGTTHLLSIASFLGEVRSRLIPNYQTRGTSQPGLQILMEAGVREAAALPNEQLKAAYEMAVKQNAEDMKMNELQLALNSANEIVSFHLLHCASSMAGGVARTSDFLNKLAARARLTPQEQAEARSGSK